MVLGGFVSSANASDLKPKAADLALAPHKALYDIRLISTQSGSQILNISGQMFYEWQPNCDAWITNHRFNLLYEYADSSPMSVVSDFSSYETFDGRSLNFTSQRKRDGELVEEIRGQATLDEKGVGVANYTLPEVKTKDLPQGTMFPIAHSKGILNAIREGKKIYHATIFDGSDQEGAVEVNAVIGKPVQKPAKLEPAKGGSIDYKLLNVPAHQVRLAFFPVTATESVSDYEMAMTLYENGVIDSMEIEYAEFTLSQNLIAIEPVKDACVTDRFNR